MNNYHIIHSTNKILIVFYPNNLILIVFFEQHLYRIRKETNYLQI